ncbi:MAG: RelA/SpoT family protein [Bacilli bacterium]
MKNNTYNDLIKLLKTYMSEEDIKKVDEYYSFSKEIYEGMKRLSGEDYITHPISVSYIIASLHMDYITVGCSLIHEAITLNKATIEEIKEKFGEESSIILNSISKLTSLKKNFKKENDAEKFRRVVVSLSENPKALFIKLADRCHNLRTINIHEKSHQEEIVEETQKVYIPIAHRLGTKDIKGEMEDSCLRISKPEVYGEILDKINASNNELHKDLNIMQDEITELLNEHHINFKITSRVKSVTGIYNKLKVGKTWNNIYDLLGLRIIVEKDEECYLVIGLIHSKYKAIPKRFKDFIANPKSNMYQSVHTTVFGVKNKMYEVQVRTYEMDEIAEKGIASHWSYKEKSDGSKRSELQNKLDTFRALIEVKDIEGNLNFFSNLDNELNNEEIYVYTPKGDIIELPKGSSPVDFAYRIHTEVGNNTIGAVVNGHIVKLDYILSDGDVIELRTQTGKSPSRAWLKFVKTDQAKSRIRSYYYKREKEKLIDTGKEMITHEFRKRKVSENEYLKENIIKDKLKEYNIENIEELYMAVSLLRYTPTQIVNKFIVEEKEEEVKLKTDNSSTSKNNIIIDGNSDILCSIASCCSPVYGEEIIGYVTRGNGVSIHKINCKNIDEKSGRIVNASWNKTTLDKYTAKITIEVSDANESLTNAITLATKYNIVVTSFNEVSNDEYILTCKVDNIDTLNIYIQGLNSTKYIVKAERKHEQ